jgi:hypothetical protein
MVSCHDCHGVVSNFHVENGNITEIRDLSKKMEEERKQNIYKSAQPRSNSNKDIENWIKKTFSLDY